MTRRLSRSIIVEAPSSFATAYVNMYFIERGAQSEGAALPLRFPLPALFVDGLILEKTVRVTLAFRAAQSGKPVEIGWEPIGKSPVPGFSGALSARALTADRCELSIAGSYTPPGGIPGAVFDALIGVHIAQATLSALLGQFARAVESDFRRRSNL